ncbi:hypothetical protein QBC44DRAFT_95477 [Cladorrhinum sp. PSN332]|nr:hypothetical protein QBC44DRAFT_95477 [Cladorrhinum sp. PSN332]
MANKSLPLVLETIDQDRPDYWIYDINRARKTMLPEYPAFEETQESLAELLANATTNQPVSLDFDPRDCITATGDRNCSEACSNQTSLFIPTNLRPCVLLAGAALLGRNGTLSLNRSDPGTVTTIRALDIPEFSTFPAINVLTAISKCVSASCSTSRLGNCTEEVLGMGARPVSVSRLTDISTNLEQYCRAAKPEINGDIAGPGVILSYFFQASLALFFYFALGVCTTWTRRSLSAIRGCVGPLGTRGKELQAKLATSRFGAAVASSLMEFQEVQIYLVASIQVATLISFDSKNTSTGLDNSDSFASAIVNARVAPSLSIMSMAPVLLIQCCLQRSGMHWWYTFLTMSAAFIMALAIFAKRDNLMPDEDSLWDKFKADNTLAACGENPSPMVLCRSQPSRYPFGAEILYTAGYLMSSFGALAWGGLLLDQIVVSAKVRFPGSSLAQRLRKMEPSRVLGWFQMGYYFVVEGILIVYTVFYILLLGMLVRTIDMADSGNWSFGQLIAVLVWTPTIAKYIYFNIFGIKEGFEERLAKAYTITRQTKAESDLGKAPEGVESDGLPSHSESKPGGDNEAGLLDNGASKTVRRTW